MRSRKVIPVLAVSHVDHAAATRWLRWASFLAQQPGGDVSNHRLIVFCSKRVAADVAKLVAAIIPSKHWFHVDFATAPDENEVGYPMSANHLFLRSLEHCHKNYPDFAPLFIEADCVPVAATWFSDVCTEYAKCGKEFMGDFVESNEPHLTGNAVYSPRWPSLAKSILGVLERKMSGGMFPDGRGYPFDLHIGSEILPQAHHSDTIFQKWAPGVWHASNLHRIPESARLVHQDKEGTLVMTIARKSYPEFFEHLPKATSIFMLQAPTSNLNLGGRIFEFTPCARSGDGGWWSVLKASDYDEEVMLSSVSGKMGVSTINQSDYQALLRQKR